MVRPTIVPGSEDDILTLRIPSGRTRALTDDDPRSLISWFLDGRRSRRQEAALIEQKIAACMHDRGFSYRPYVGIHDGDVPTVGEWRRYRDRYGFGVLFSMQDQVVANPNEASMAALGADQRAAYALALWGRPEGPEMDPPDVPSPDATGCNAIATRQARSGLPRYDRNLRFYLLRNQINRHPLMRNANKKWVGCMAEQGFTVSLEHWLDPRLEELQERAEKEPASLEETRQSELDLAQADVTCSLRTRYPTMAVVETALLSRVAERYPVYADAVDAVLTETGRA